MPRFAVSSSIVTSVAVAASAVLLASCEMNQAGGNRPVTQATPAQQSAQELVQAADRGDVAAQARVGTALLVQALQGPTDRRAANGANAVRYLRLAADKGNAQAQYGLGIAYFNGVGVAQNRTEAVRLYRLSAEQNHGDGQASLGNAYLYGNGVPQDFSEAREWLVKAAEKGSAIAQTDLGIIYSEGRGVAKDDMQAREWFQKAAEKGNGAGQLGLANFYGSGRGGGRDDMLAYFWANLAAVRLTGTTATTAANVRDAFGRRLSQAELERAQTAARNWKAGQALDMAQLGRDPRLRRRRGDGGGPHAAGLRHRFRGEQGRSCPDQCARGRQLQRSARPRGRR